MLSFTQTTDSTYTYTTYITEAPPGTYIFTAYMANSPTIEFDFGDGPITYDQQLGVTHIQPMVYDDSHPTTRDCTSCGLYVLDTPLSFTSNEVDTHYIQKHTGLNIDVSNVVDLTCQEFPAVRNMFGFVSQVAAIPNITATYDHVSRCIVAFDSLVEQVGIYPVGVDQVAEIQGECYAYNSQDATINECREDFPASVHAYPVSKSVLGREALHDSLDFSLFAYSDCELSEWASAECTSKCTTTVPEPLEVTRTFTAANGLGTCPQATLDQSTNLTYHKSCYDISECPVDCKLTAWSSWDRECGTCTESFERSRTRTVDVEPQFNGASCGPLEETEICPMDMSGCSTTCVFGVWNNVGECSNRCGAGTREQVRELYPSEAGGCDAMGSSRTVDCVDETQCPIDCVVSAWTDWSSCDSQCTNKVPGYQKRSRVVTTVSEFYGQACPALVETQTCIDNSKCPQVLHGSPDRSCLDAASSEYDERAKTFCERLEDYETRLHDQETKYNAHVQARNADLKRMHDYVDQTMHGELRRLQEAYNKAKTLQRTSQDAKNAKCSAFPLVPYGQEAFDAAFDACASANETWTSAIAMVVQRTSEHAVDVQEAETAATELADLEAGRTEVHDATLEASIEAKKAQHETLLEDVRKAEQAKKDAEDALQQALSNRTVVCTHGALHQEQNKTVVAALQAACDTAFVSNTTAEEAALANYTAASTLEAMYGLLHAASTGSDGAVDALQHVPNRRELVRFQMLYDSFAQATALDHVDAAHKALFDADATDMAQKQLDLSQQIVGAETACNSHDAAVLKRDFYDRVKFMLRSAFHELLGIVSDVHSPAVPSRSEACAGIKASVEQAWHDLHDAARKVRNNQAVYLYAGRTPQHSPTDESVTRDATEFQRRSIRMDEFQETFDAAKTSADAMTSSVDAAIGEESQWFDDLLTAWETEFASTAQAAAVAYESAADEYQTKLAEQYTACAQVRERAEDQAMTADDQTKINNCDTAKEDSDTAKAAKQTTLDAYTTALETASSSFVATAQAKALPSAVGSPIAATSADVRRMFEDVDAWLTDLHAVHNAQDASSPDVRRDSRYHMLTQALELLDTDIADAKAQWIQLASATDSGCKDYYQSWLVQRALRQVYDDSIADLAEVVQEDGKWYHKHSTAADTFKAAMAITDKPACDAARAETSKKLEALRVRLYSVLLNEGRFLTEIAALTAEQSATVENVLDHLTKVTGYQDIVFDYYNDLHASLSSSGDVTVDMNRKSYKSEYALESAGFDDAFQYSVLAGADPSCPSVFCDSTACNLNGETVTNPECVALFTSVDYTVGPEETPVDTLTGELQAWYDAYDGDTLLRAPCEGDCTDPMEAWNFPMFREHATDVGRENITSQFTGDIATIAGTCGDHTKDGRRDVFTLSVTSTNVFRQHTAKALLPDVFRQCTSRQIKYVVDADHQVDAVFTVPLNDNVQIGIDGALQWVQEYDGRYRLEVPIAVYARCADGQECSRFLEFDNQRSVTSDSKAVWATQAAGHVAVAAHPVVMDVDGLDMYMRKSSFTIVSQPQELKPEDGCSLPASVVNLLVPVCRREGAECHAEDNGLPRELGVSLNVKFSECPKNVMEVVEGSFALSEALEVYSIRTEVKDYTFASGLQQNILEGVTFTDEAEKFAATSQLLYKNGVDVSKLSEPVQTTADDWVYIVAKIADDAYSAESLHSVRIARVECKNELGHSEPLVLYSEGQASALLPNPSKHRSECKKQPIADWNARGEKCPWIVPAAPDWSVGRATNYDVVSFPATRLQSLHPDEQVLWTGHYDCTFDVRMLYQDGEVPGARRLLSAADVQMYSSNAKLSHRVSLHPSGYKVKLRTDLKPAQRHVQSQPRLETTQQPTTALARPAVADVSEDAPYAALAEDAGNCSAVVERETLRNVVPDASTLEQCWAKAEKLAVFQGFVAWDNASQKCWVLRSAVPCRLRMAQTFGRMLSADVAYMVPSFIGVIAVVTFGVACCRRKQGSEGNMPVESSV